LPTLAVRLPAVPTPGVRAAAIHGPKMKDIGIRCVMLAVLFIGCLNSPLLAADKTQEVKFAAGQSAATIKGSLKGYDTNSYLLVAQAGQTMSIQLKPSNLACYFNVMEPNADSAVFIGSTSGFGYSGALRVSGQQRVDVYLMRSAARRNEVCSYSISFAITDGGAAAEQASQSDFADGLAGGPDYWEVAGVPAGDTLNVRSDPSTSGRVILELDNGAVLRNMGCKITGSTRWCQVQLTGDSDAVGWVAGRYLREASGDAQAAARQGSDALVPGTNFHATGAMPCTFKGDAAVNTCAFGVVREGNGVATVTVMFPFGFVRTLRFHDNMVSTHAAGDKVAYSREGDTMFVSINDDAETFVIYDVIIYGD